MPATFNDLPPSIHSRILAYAITPPFPLTSFSCIPVDIFKHGYYRQYGQRYEAVNHVWRYLVQENLWRNLCLAPFEIEQLRGFFTTNPALATYTRSLKLRSRVRTSSDPPRPTNPAPSPIPFDEAAGDTAEGLRIARVWSEVLELLQTYVLLHGRFERLTIDVGLGVGKESRLVQFPGGYELPEGLGGVKGLELAMLKAKRGEHLGMASIGRMVGSVGAALEELHLIVSGSGVGERTIRREVYVGLTHLITQLKPCLTPHLTSLYLSYPAFLPSNSSETRIYSYTHADAGADLLSRALRVLSKHLISFTYLGGRISTDLFRPSSAIEDPTWPHLKHYTVDFAPITPSGTWLFTFLDPSSPSYTTEIRPPTPPSPPSDDEMSATDDDYVDDVDYDYDAPNRSAPVRALIDELFEAACAVMVPNMPVIEYWELRAQRIGGMDVGMGLRFDYEETGRPRITRGKAYEHSKSTMGAWEARFGRVQSGRKRKRGGEETAGLLLVKQENSGACGVSCMDEEDQRSWRWEESQSSSNEDEEMEGEE